MVNQDVSFRYERFGMNIQIRPGYLLWLAELLVRDSLSGATRVTRHMLCLSCASVFFAVQNLLGCGETPSLRTINLSPIVPYSVLDLQALPSNFPEDLDFCHTSCVGLF